MGTYIPGRKARGALLIAAGFLLAAAAWVTHLNRSPSVEPRQPRDGGVIYCRTLSPPSNGFGGVRCMSPDGLVASALEVRWEAEPSIYLHGGERWFLQTGERAEETYADGTPRCEVFAVTNSGRSVQITHHSGVQPVRESRQAFRWTADDERLSYVAFQWSEGQVVDAAIYTAGVCWRDGAPLPCCDEPTKVVGGLLDRATVSCGGYDWSPDGRRLAYADGKWFLRVIDRDTSRVLWTLPDSYDPC